MLPCDFKGQIGDIDSGSHATRLESRAGETVMTLLPEQKAIQKLRAQRPDIFIVGFKTTTGASNKEMLNKSPQNGRRHGIS